MVRWEVVPEGVELGVAVQTDMHAVVQHKRGESLITAVHLVLPLLIVHSTQHGRLHHLHNLFTITHIFLQS